MTYSRRFNESRGAPELDRLVFRLREAKLPTNRFMRLHEDKDAFETGWENNPSDVEDLITYPRWGCAGREGLVCIDADDAVMAGIIRGIIRTTFETQSPRRQLPHFYIKVVGGQVPNRTLYHADNKKGGEIRANNHYLVAPGTEIRYKDLATGEEKTGRYTITQDIPIATMTYEAFMEAFKIHLKGNGDETQRLRPEQITKGVAAGERHAVGIKFATRLVGYSGLSPDQALASMRIWNQDLKPPMDDADLIRMVKNAKGYVDEEADKEKNLFSAISKSTLPIDLEEKTVNISPGRYWILNKRGEPTFQYSLMLIDLVKKYKIITFTDTEQSYLYDEATGTYLDTAINTAKQFMLMVLKGTFKKSISEEIIYQLKILTSIERSTVDPPPELFNLKNGVLNINTKERIPHTSKYFFTTMSPTNYDPKATRPHFDKLLQDIACKKIDTVQEFCGDLLHDQARYKKALFLSGPTDSGKTTFTNAIINVLGKESICSIALQNLDHRFQAQRIYKKKVNLCGDLGAEAFKSVAMFRRTTGGDLVESEIKGANKGLGFYWGGKHWFDANDLPKTEGDADSDAFYNRLLLAAYSNQIPKDKIDRQLPKKLEGETSGILNWMLEGYDRLTQNDGFSDGSGIEEIKEHYRRSSDNIYCFTQDRCRVEKGKFIIKANSHKKYITYCIEKGFSPKGRGTFYELLQTQLPAIATAREKINGETPQVWMNIIISDVDLKKEEDPPTGGVGDGGDGKPNPLPKPTTTIFTTFTTTPALPPPATLPHHQPPNIEEKIKMTPMEQGSRDEGAGNGHGQDMVNPVKTVKEFAPICESCPELAPFSYQGRRLCKKHLDEMIKQDGKMA